MTINNNTPKGLKYTFALHHGPKDANDEEHLAYEISGDEDFQECTLAFLMLWCHNNKMRFSRHCGLHRLESLLFRRER